MLELGIRRKQCNQGENETTETPAQDHETEKGSDDMKSNAFMLLFV
jgi:hypothetical protein